jgi:predicted cupin superfamily sugar epimerase
LTAPLTARDVIRLLDLKPHPEGGHFRKTFRDTGVTRAASTAIYFLLARGERSHWHRVDAVEVWHWYPGRRSNLKSRKEGAANASRSAAISPRANGRRPSHPLVPTMRRKVSATGRFAAAPSRRASTSQVRTGAERLGAGLA